MAFSKVNVLSECFRKLKPHFSIQRNMSLLHDGLPQTGYHFVPPGGANSRLGISSSSDIKVTLTELKLALAKEMGVDRPYSRTLPQREQLVQYLPKTQEEMPPRSMRDSFVEAIIPLGKNVALQEKYTTFLGSVRLGRLLEDMDIFTVIVARKHILNPKAPADAPFPQTLVTVLVDRIEFTEYLPKPNQDIKISGHVSWVGKSTLEVVVWLEQLENDQWQRITRALFLLAARDSSNTYASVVNPINPADEREKTILAGGEDRKRKRMEIDSTSLGKVLPTLEEQKAIHGIFTRSTDPKDISMSKRILPTGCAWMKDSVASNVILAQPEDRNLHNKVFGGFIMRQATELSWVLGYTYSKYRPRTRCLSDISFRQPIAVNSLIQMHATVVYTYKNYMQNMVFAQVYNPLSGKSATTNMFHLTLEAPDEVPEVLPLTYHEAMLYLEGKRQYEKNMKNLRDTKGGFRSKL